MSHLDTLAAQVPQELRVKLMQHFGIAKEYEKNPETISITYYCLMYIADEGLKLQKEIQEVLKQRNDPQDALRLQKIKQFIVGVLDYLETTKRNNPNDEIIRSMGTGQATIEELITVLVAETNEAEDNEAKTSEQLRLLMRKHYTVGGLTDVLSVFGAVKEDFQTLGRIAKSRAVGIFRELKAGGGGAGAGAGAGASGGGASSAARPSDSNTGASNRGISPSYPPQQPPSQMPQPPPSSSASSHPGASYYDQSSGNKNIPFDVINQAQKLCRYANSALEHEDIGTAVKNCEQVLQLLRPYNN